MFSSRFTPYATFPGLKDAVLSLSFSLGGRFMVATGYCGVSVWDIENGARVSIPIGFSSPNPMDASRIFTTSQWVFFENGEQHVLLLGGLDGALTAWKWNEATVSFEILSKTLPSTTSSQIICMEVYEKFIKRRLAGSSNPHTAYVLISHADKSVTVCTLSSSGNFANVFTTILEATIHPKSVKFDKRRDICVFGYAGGDVALLDGHSGAVSWRKSTGLERIGNVAFHKGLDHFVVSTCKDCQVFSFSTLKRVRKLDVSSPALVLFPKQLAFIDCGDGVVAGTDAGHAVVYDLGRSQIKQRLVYRKGGLVQTVAAYENDEWVYVAIAGSGAETESDVLLFRRRTRSAFRLPGSKILLYVLISFLALLGICICIASSTPPPPPPPRSGGPPRAYASVIFPPSRSPISRPTRPTFIARTPSATHSIVKDTSERDEIRQRIAELLARERKLHSVVIEDEADDARSQDAYDNYLQSRLSATFKDNIAVADVVSGEEWEDDI
ncbi:hypothetical protein PM082_018375 [Marasmius tenuissimus]|nr:hypothetical protein PM082_018375 [Marasmius tenuissimus]